jgi:uncharacterized protein YndB with AHSA1/START domain
VITANSTPQGLPTDDAFTEGFWVCAVAAAFSVLAALALPSAGRRRRAAAEHGVEDLPADLETGARPGRAPWTSRHDEDMVEVRRKIDASPADVFAVVADGWTYPSWVVGAVRMRAVDDSFPEVGTRLHHSVGAWPLMIHDHTEVKRYDPGKRLVLQGRAWPAGEAEIDIELTPDGTGTLVTMREDAVRGPATAVPSAVRAAGLVVRNKETLRRLAFLAERRTAPPEE